MARGHVRQRGKDTWQLEVDLGYYIDPKTGKKKRHKKYKTIKTKSQRQAELELARFVAEVTGEGYFEPEKMNFVDFVQKEWWPKWVEKNLAHTTQDVYRRYLDARILPAFQFLRMDQVRPMHIMDFLDNLSEEGLRLDKEKGKLSGATIEYHHRILKSIFRFAVKMQIIKDNPMDGIDKPKFENKKIEVYTQEEASALLECLEEEPLHWRIIIKLAITAGLRRSELLGLEFKHFDLENRVLHVEQAVTYTKEEGYKVHPIKKGESRARQRDIVISEFIISDIKKLQLERKKERLANADRLWEGGKYNFLLCDEIGKPYNPRTIQRWWERFIKRHNLKYINIHALRHTSATLLINAGVHAKIISERLGHADITTTMNIYGHALRQADAKATEVLDQTLFSNRKTNQSS